MAVETVTPGGTFAPSPMLDRAKVLTGGLATVKLTTLVPPAAMSAGLKAAVSVGGWKTWILAVAEFPWATSDKTADDCSWMTPGANAGTTMLATWQVALGEIVAPTSDTPFPEVLKVPPQTVRGALAARATEKKTSTVTDVRVCEASGFLIENSAVTLAETGACTAEKAAEICGEVLRATIAGSAAAPGPAARTLPAESNTAPAATTSGNNRLFTDPSLPAPEPHRGRRPAMSSWGKYSGSP